MRRIAIALLAALVAAVAVTASAPARTVAPTHVVVAPAASFSSTGSIATPWWWLRTPRATATWTFNLAPVQSARIGSVYLLFSPLVTNDVNGGSGYSRSIRVLITPVTTRPTTARPALRWLQLVNPFRPIAPENSGGVGYQTYGHLSLATSLWRGIDSITVSTTWLSGHHVAVKADTVQLSYRAP